MAEYDPRLLTPGSAVARTLQDILARRRAESRQEMLDKLGLEEQQSQISFRQAQTQAEKDRLGIMRQAEERAKLEGEAQITSDTERRYLDQLRTFGRPGMVPEEVGSDKLREFMKGQGMFQNVPVQGPTETGEPLSPIEAYPGTTEQQEVTRQQGLRDTLAGRMGEFDTSKSEGRAALFGEGMRAGVSLPSLLDPKAIDYPTQIIDPISGRLIREAPAGYGVVKTEQPWTTRFAGAGQQFVNIVDPNTGRIVNQGQFTPQEINQFEAQGLRVERQFAGTSPQLPHQIPPTLLKSAQDAAARLAMSEETEAGKWRFGGLYSPPTDATTLAARRDFNMAVGAIFGSDPAEDIVKEAAIKVLSDPELSKLSTSVVISHPKFTEEFEGITPRQISDLERLVTFARGAFPLNVPAPSVNGR